VELRGRICVVTGASSGIGRATALALARRGNPVVAVARRAERLRELVAECARHAPASQALAGDLGERAFAERIVGETVERHGRIDVLVNNAAVPLRKSVYQLSVEEVEAVFRVNFFACVWTTLAAIPPMLRQGGGALVNVSSFASKVVPPRECAYAASKGALNGFTESLWGDLAGSGIHATLVYPGPIDTEIWGHGEPAGYRGRRHPPERVAEAILDAVERRRHEVVVPRYDPQLGTARLLRFVLPGLVRAGLRRMDPVEPEALERARERARQGKRLGEA
jgi:short-subunit dehydrogenase